MDQIQALRKYLNVPLIENSGYRCPKHPIEKKKANPGAHASRKAIDFQVNGRLAFDMVNAMGIFKFTGIGIGLRTGYSLFHLDMCTEADGAQFKVRPNVWTY